MNPEDLNIILIYAVVLSGIVFIVTRPWRKP